MRRLAAVAGCQGFAGIRLPAPHGGGPNSIHPPAGCHTLAGKSALALGRGFIHVRSFEGKTAAPVKGKPKAPPKLGALDCGEFDRFWKVHGG